MRANSDCLRGAGPNCPAYLHENSARASHIGSFQRYAEWYGISKNRVAKTWLVSRDEGPTKSNRRALPCQSIVIGFYKNFQDRRD